jgi:transposase
MRRKERDQIAIFEQVKNKQLTQKQASTILKLSLRQIKRRFKRYIIEGPDGLIHKGRGRESNRKIDQEAVNKVIAILKDRMNGFGPTFAAEKLMEDYSINMSHEALRKIMIENDFWKPKNRKIKKHVWRERKHCLGELIQLDCSKHIWFGDEYYTLILFIDDATGKIMYAHFVKEETLKDIALATQKYIEIHGRPLVIYVDRGKVFKVNNSSKEAITQYHRMLNELDIELKFAYSPQAKGRVERSFGTHQDRLVNEFNYYKITSIEQANEFLHSVYINKHNSMFSIKPQSDANMHRSTKEMDLKSIFCIKENRILKEDSTIVYKNQWYQLDRNQQAVLRNKDKITLLIDFDGTIVLIAKGKRLSFKKIPKQLPRKPKEKNQLKREKQYFKRDFLFTDKFNWEGDTSTLRKR